MIPPILTKFNTDSHNIHVFTQYNTSNYDGFPFRDQEAGGSNPLTPTTEITRKVCLASFSFALI